MCSTLIIINLSQFHLLPTQLEHFVQILTEESVRGLVFAFNISKRKGSYKIGAGQPFARGTHKKSPIIVFFMSLSYRAEVICICKRASVCRRLSLEELVACDTNALRSITISALSSFNIINQVQLHDASYFL